MRKRRAAARISLRSSQGRVVKAGREARYNAKYHERYYAFNRGASQRSTARHKLVLTSDEASARIAHYGGFRLEMRPGSSDVKIAVEVLRRKAYHKAFQRTDAVWGDFGAHIGCFAVYALSRGAKKVHCWEPFPGSRSLLRRNLAGCPVKIHCQAVSWDGKSPVKLFLHGRTDARHTLLPVRGRKSLVVQAARLADVLNAHEDINAIKLDIEGSEIEILQRFRFPARIRALTFEWSYSVQPAPSVLRKVLAKLRQSSWQVMHAPSALRRPRLQSGGWMRMHNRDVIVSCVR